MKPLDKFPDEYFLKYRQGPLKLHLYNPKQERVANYYIAKLRKLLGKKVGLMIRGSTAFKILGKGEVEVGIYPKVSHWEGSIALLKRVFGNPENQEQNYLRFNDTYEGKQVEIILLKGYEAEVDIKLHEYLIAHPKLLKEYEDIKIKYCFSKREYQRQKSEFLARVISEIPEGN